MANVELLEKVYEYIKNNPQSWKQTVWFAWVDDSGKMVDQSFDVDVEEVNSCKTAFCFAGRAALMSGFAAPPKSNGLLWTDVIDGKEYHVNEFAMEKLNLTWGQADELFAAENTMDDIRAIIDMITENPGVTEGEIRSALGRADDDYDDYECSCCSGDDSYAYSENSYY